MQVEGELDSFVVFVFAFQLFGVFDAQPELNGDHFPIVFLGQFHAHSRLLLEESMVQQDFDGVSGTYREKKREIADDTERSNCTKAEPDDAVNKN